jgi:polyisoprenoid-binding protein YceI
MTTPAEHAPAALRQQLAAGSLAGTWTLDPARSTARLRARHMWGLAPVNGQFRRLAGQGTISHDGHVSGHFVLDTGHLDTGNARRDAHLRSADFFHTEDHPEITFTLDTLGPGDHDLTITGTLTVRGTTRPITFPATISVTGDAEAVLDATVDINRSDYGISINHLGMVKMNCTVTLHVVFTRT